MDNLVTILAIAAFIIFSIIQDRKNKQKQQERMRKMAQQQAEEEPQGDTTIDTAPKRPQPQRSFMRNPGTDELLARHQEMLKSLPQAAPIQPPMASKPQYNNTPKPQQKRARGVTNTAKNTQKTTQPPVNAPKSPSKEFDFDIERAVVEAEILKPKYLEY